MARPNISVSVWIWGSPAYHNAEIRVTQSHADGSEDSFKYPVKIDGTGLPADAEEWAKEALIQVIEAL